MKFIYMTFINNYTRHNHVYLVSHKTEALKCFRRFMNLMGESIKLKNKSFKNWS